MADKKFIDLDILNYYNTKVLEKVDSKGYLTGITSSQVTGALGYTPYNSTNPNGYVTSSGSVASATKATQDGNGNVITSTYATKIEAGEITTISKEITVNTDWTDTGITGSDLSSGTYYIQANCNWSGAAGLWDETYSGIMYWFSSGETNSANSTEILLHNSGHADNAGAIYLRTIRTARTEGVGMKLQIASKIAYTDSTKWVTFKFRKII